MADYNFICDNLIDETEVEDRRRRFMRESMYAYEKTVTLLGYFSQIKDHQEGYADLVGAAFDGRSLLISLYTDELVRHHSKYFKQIVCPPKQTKWFRQGVSKFEKVRNYTTFYYRRKLYVELDQSDLNTRSLGRVISSIVCLDKYYDIYDDTINYFVNTNQRFANVMKEHFAEFIFL